MLSPIKSIHCFKVWTQSNSIEKECKNKMFCCLIVFEFYSCCGHCGYRVRNIATLVIHMQGTHTCMLMGSLYYIKYFQITSLEYEYYNNKSSGSGSIGTAANYRPLTSAIPLLTHTGTLGCWVSPLALSAPP